MFAVKNFLEGLGVGFVLLTIAALTLVVVYHNDPIGTTRMVCSAMTSNAIDNTSCTIRYWPASSTN